MKSLLQFARRAILLLTSQNRRQSKALERLVELYEMDLNSRGISTVKINASIKDEVEIQYGSKVDPDSARHIYNDH